MVGHDAPSDQTVPLVVEMQKGIFHHSGNAFVAQPAGAVPHVLVAGDEVAELDLSGIGGGEVCDPGELGLPGLEDGVGNGVVETEGEELGEVALIEVREVASRTPGGGGGGRRRGWWSRRG